MFENFLKNRKPMGGKRSNPLDNPSLKMLKQQRNFATLSQKQFNESQRLLRNLEQQRQRNQRSLDLMRQQCELQRQQHQNWIEEGIRTRQAEARQRQQKLMEQWRQPIRTPEPFKPPMRYEPPKPFEPPPTRGPRIPPPGWGSR